LCGRSGVEIPGQPNLTHIVNVLPPLQQLWK